MCTKRVSEELDLRLGDVLWLSQVFKNTDSKFRMLFCAALHILRGSVAPHWARERMWHRCEASHPDWEQLFTLQKLFLHS